jgi:hypothetical protein
LTLSTMSLPVFWFRAWAGPSTAATYECQREGESEKCARGKRPFLTGLLTVNRGYHDSSRRPRGLGLVPKDAVILTPAPWLSPLDKETVRHWLGLGIIRACNQNRPTNGRGSASLNTAFGLFWFWRGFSPSGGSEVTKKTPASAPTRFQEKAPAGSAGLISAFR